MLQNGDGVITVFILWKDDINSEINVLNLLIGIVWRTNIVYAWHRDKVVYPYQSHKLLSMNVKVWLHGRIRCKLCACFIHTFDCKSVNTTSFGGPHQTYFTTCLDCLIRVWIMCTRQVWSEFVGQIWCVNEP
jgi:hypothetical protein